MCASDEAKKQIRRNETAKLEKASAHGQRLSNERTPHESLVSHFVAALLPTTPHHPAIMDDLMVTQFYTLSIAGSSAAAASSTTTTTTTTTTEPSTAIEGFRYDMQLQPHHHHHHYSHTPLLPTSSTAKLHLAAFDTMTQHVLQPHMLPPPPFGECGIIPDAHQELLASSGGGASLLSSNDMEGCVSRRRRRARSRRVCSQPLPLACRYGDELSFLVQRMQLGDSDGSHESMPYIL